ncbi:MAG: VOC family protein [Alphaproteobacteria bacterium]
MSRSILGIDHALVAVRDLEAARIAYRRLGFAVSPRGSHIGWGTANYCIMFPDDYVELIGIIDSSQFTNNLDKFLARREGLMGLAWATRDAAATKTELTQSGIAGDGPKDLKRRLELPDGTALPAFKLIYLPQTATPALSSFICQHLTPELVRRPEWLTHANGAIGLKGISVAVASVEGLAEAYTRLFGSGAVTRTDDTVSVRVGGHLVMFATPDGLDMLHPGIEPPSVSSMPYPLVMTVRVEDLAKTASYLERKGVDPGSIEDGSALVGPEDSVGLWLEFIGG